VITDAVSLPRLFSNTLPIREPKRSECADDRGNLLVAISELTGAMGTHLVRHTDATGTFCDPLRGRTACSVDAETFDLIENALVARCPALEPIWTRRSAILVRDVLVAKLADRTDGSLWIVLEFDRHDRQLAARASDLLRPIAMIVEAHLAQGDQVNELRDHKRAAMAALDRDDCGTIALKADNTIVFANAAAQTILAEEAVLQIRRGVVRPTRYQDAVRFQVALDCVLANAAVMNGRRRGAIMMLEHPTYTRPLVAVLVPVQAHDAGTNGMHETSAIIYLIRPDRVGQRGLDQLCQLYKLTPVETRLVGQLVGGNCVATAASNMRIKPDTARAYLKQIFAKTGTHRQAELLHLIGHSLRGIPTDVEFDAL
jgi:DNA-binding CsgD family transcriptional regulator/PAS domain-containing protein